MASAFFDSNVILYSASSDTTKADRADDLIRGGGWISVQVLNEVATVARRKMGYGWPRVHELLDAIQQMTRVSPLSIAEHRAALAIAERSKIAIFDAMIVACALKCGCSTLWSEDMRHGLVIEGKLTIINPFRA